MTRSSLTRFSRNAFALEFGQAVLSAGTHGVALVTVARGGAGEVPVQIQAHSAESSAALWDRRNRRVSAAVTVSDVDEERPTEFVAYLPHVVLVCTYRAGSGGLRSGSRTLLGVRSWCR
jgi:hypothetical protein